jgi:hypothetical protein
MTNGTMFSHTLQFSLIKLSLATVESIFKYLCGFYSFDRETMFRAVELEQSTNVWLLLG